MSVAGLYSSVLLSEKIALNVVVITGRDGILSLVILQESLSKKTEVGVLSLSRAGMQLVILYSSCEFIDAQGNLGDCMSFRCNLLVVDNFVPICLM